MFSGIISIADSVKKMAGCGELVMGQCVLNFFKLWIELRLTITSTTDNSAVKVGSNEVQMFRYCTFVRFCQVCVSSNSI